MMDRNKAGKGAVRGPLHEGAVCSHILKVGQQHASKRGLHGQEAEECARDFLSEIYEEYHQALQPGSAVLNSEAYLQGSAHKFTQDYWEAWKHRIQKERLCLAEMRSSEEAAQTVEWADPAPGPEEIVEAKELRRALTREIEGLHPELRACLLAFYGEGKAAKQIAEEQGCSLDTIYQRLTLSRHRLMTALKRKGWT
jgi:RNA polymerase sigma factor (sigma-70 family)